MTSATDALKPRQGPAAVLWDMDGTLVDTEPYWIEACQELVRAHGGELGVDEETALVGLSLIDTARVVIGLGVGLPEERVMREISTAVQQRLTSHGTPWRPGAQSLLSELGAAGTPMALVSMSSRAIIDVFLASLAVQGPSPFRAVVAGDQVRHGKPHPEAYLTAVDALGLRPEDCLAVEDSPTGAHSAVAAGLPTLLVPSAPGGAVPGALLTETLAGTTPHGIAQLWRQARAARGLSTLP
ncbi:HAD family phosphatase [Raineyella sp. LH-20]|uniref:HAD family hydrolase n=1 Tax=Raineyella sp. LH-20 TaxID=3081204 RepID=UPI0029537306|nr:HAD family phosphatase [Raineyella sp. LH-20]WOP17733.1 HAD family phosphatase [Raineyella sp. LH-20]